MSPHVPFRPIRVVFRYDDCSGFSPLEFEKSLIGVFRERGVSCAFGIVPLAAEDQLDPQGVDRRLLPGDKAGLLKAAVAAGTVEAVLHGCTHRALPRAPGAHPSELVGLERQRQREIIGEGRDALEAALETRVGFFAPPWNTYDGETLRALSDLGFECLSAGPRFGPADRASPLRLLPATCLLTSLGEVVAAARELRSAEPTIVTLFHPYDFVEADEERGTMTLADLAETLDLVAESGDLHGVSMTSMIDAGEQLTARRFALHRSLRNTRRLAPRSRSFYRQPPGVYLSTVAASRMWRRNLLALGSLYLAGFVLAAWAAAAAASWLRPGARVAVESAELLGPFLVAGTLAYALRARLTFKGAMSTVLVLGAYVGTLIAPG